MPAGTVKFFNGDKGFGLMTPENGSADVCAYLRRRLWRSSSRWPEGLVRTGTGSEDRQIKGRKRPGDL